MGSENQGVDIGPDLEGMPTWIQPRKQQTTTHLINPLRALARSNMSTGSVSGLPVICSARTLQLSTPICEPHS